MNRKYIKFSSAGRALEQERVERLHTHQIATVHVERAQMKNFYDFTAAQLKKLEQDPAISEAERRSRMQAAIRSLLTGFLGNDSDVQDCSQIVKTYILEAHEGESSWYEKMLKLSSGGSDAYTHVSQVSTLAAMFALGLGVGTAEELALAGLLHDIGMADVPIGAQNRSENERTPEERIAYENHPNLSLEILRARKVPLPEKVYSIIAQHHERIDGNGYPKGIRGPEFLPEAQLLAIADHLDYLMRVVPGEKRRSARDALDMVLSAGAYDPELIGRLKTLFDPT